MKRVLGVKRPSSTGRPRGGLKRDGQKGGFKTAFEAEIVTEIDALVGTGRVTAGSLADLVLLDADPLVDIQNLKRVSAVVANGRLVDAALRQKLIDDELKSRKPAAPAARP